MGSCLLYWFQDLYGSRFKHYGKINYEEIYKFYEIQWNYLTKVFYKLLEVKLIDVQIVFLQFTPGRLLVDG